MQKRAAAAAASKLADAEAAHVHAQTDRTRRDAEADVAAKEAAERIRMLEREKAEAAASVLRAAVTCQACILKRISRPSSILRFVAGRPR